MIRLRLVLLLALCQMVFSDRLVFRMATGGRGMVPPTAFLIPPLALAAVIIPFWDDLRPVLRSRLFLLAWMPFLALTFLLPILGVLFGHYPSRSLFSSWSALLAVSYLAFGAVGQLRARGAERTIRRLFLLAVLAQLALAVLQTFGEYSQLPSLLQRIYDWDYQFKLATLDPETIVLARATGFYLNPNALGVWTILAFWISFFLLEGGQRRIGCVASLATLLLCQSRGSLFGFLFSAGICAAIHLVRHADRQQRRKGTLLLAVGIAVAGFLFIPGVADSTLAHLKSVPYLGDGIERYISGAKVASQGASADVSFQSRTELWRLSLDYLAAHPFGTLGSPQILLDLPQDNQFVQVTVQGSFYFLGALLLALLAGAAAIFRPRAQAQALGAASLGLLVNGISAVPFAMYAAGPFWMLVGIYLAWRVQDREAWPAEEGGP
jgi:hypothetical protein